MCVSEVWMGVCAPCAITVCIWTFWEECYLCKIKGLINSDILIYFTRLEIYLHIPHGNLILLIFSGLSYVSQTSILVYFVGYYSDTNKSSGLLAQFNTFHHVKGTFTSKTSNNTINIKGNRYCILMVCSSIYIP